jgi:hypothetical protein
VRWHFSGAENVELTLISGLFNLFNHFMDSLRVPIEDQGEVDKKKRSIRLDPEKERAYLEGLSESPPWRQEEVDEDGG